jgi:hypothetical protein
VEYAVWATSALERRKASRLLFKQDDDGTPLLDMPRATRALIIQSLEHQLAALDVTDTQLLGARWNMPSRENLAWVLDCAVETKRL